MKSVLSRALLLVVLLTPALSVAQSTSTARPFLGVRLEEAGGAVRVVAVLPESPAERAGLAGGDIVVRVADAVVSNPGELISAIAARGVGDTVPLVIRRSGAESAMSVVLTAAPAPGAVMQRYVGRPAPPINLPRSDGGGQIALSGLRGQVVLVYFWSVWCGACRMATPDLQRLQRDVGPSGLSIVGVSDDPLDRLRQSTGAGSMPFPVLHDAGSKVGASYWVEAVPSFFLVDRAGNVAYVQEGWDPSAGATIEREIRQLLAPAAP